MAGLEVAVGNTAGSALAQRGPALRQTTRANDAAACVAAWLLAARPALFHSVNCCRRSVACRDTAPARTTARGPVGTLLQLARDANRSASPRTRRLSLAAIGMREGLDCYGVTSNALG